jgi:rhomboid protease GluP
MSIDSSVSRDADFELAASALPNPKIEPTPWVTHILGVGCIAVFLGLTNVDGDSWAVFAKFGVLPAESVWGGSYWALVTSAFVHAELWHLAFNLYWFWKFGTYLERAIGSWRFLLFVVISAFVSSSYQLASSDQTGIGLSGVVYAIFGLMWISRPHFLQFNKCLDSKTIQLFFLWLVGCIVATVAGIWNVGNAAHVSGLLFGVLVARSFITPLQTQAMQAGLATLMICSIIPLFWCPWSITWLSQKAYQAHVAQQFDVALNRYSEIISRAPDNAWAYLNRSGVYEALGESEKADADLTRAREIDPTIDKLRQ